MVLQKYILKENLNSYLGSYTNFRVRKICSDIEFVQATINTSDKL